MKLDVEDVRQLVSEVEKDREQYVKAAAAWEKMWRLDVFTDEPDVADEMGQVQRVATADPYNIVQLVQRFVADNIRLEVPYLSATDDDEQRSTKLEEWLIAFHQRNSRQQGRNIIQDMTWLTAVRGRGALQVLWVKDVLPARLKSRRLPILLRTLDPLNVGVKRGPLWTEYAYHKYRAKASYIKQHYPDFEIPEYRGADRWRRESVDYEVVDFWYADDDGAIWNCVTVGASSGQNLHKAAFAKQPVRTDYPDIPIIEWTGDGAPLDDEFSRSLSILHPIHQTWPAKCKAISDIATATRYYTNPLIVTRNIPEDIRVGPGATVKLTSEKQAVDVVEFNANIPIVQTFLDLLESQIGQSTFPPVLYGDSGNMQAGYGVNLLAQQARGRIKTIRDNMESALEKANELVLTLVEAFGGDEGVEIWGGSDYQDRKRMMALVGKDIKGNYANEVSLIPEVPTDESQRITTWLQLVREKVISSATFRDRILNIAMPRDEDLRVSIEQTMLMPEMQVKKALRSIQRYYPDRDSWETLIHGTPLEQAYMDEQEWQRQKAAEKEQDKLAKAQAKYRQTGIPPAGYHVMPDGTLMSNKDMPSPPSGTMGPPPMEPPSPGMMPPGMPPGAPPPPVGPPMGPPPLPGSESAPMQPPGLPAVPAELAGQITPEMAGIVPGMPPGMLNQVLGDDQAMMQALAEERMRGPGRPPAMP